MNLNKSSFATQDNNLKDLDNAKDYPTLADLMREQNISNNQRDTVHQRRDLDSLWYYVKIKLAKSKTKKKTLSSLGDGDSYHDKYSRRRQPHN